MSLNLDKSTWTRVAFGDVVRNVNVTIKDPKAVGIERAIAMEHLDSGELKVSRWGSTENGTTFTRLVKAGQTLFGKRRAYQRKAAYADFDAITSGDILVFESDEGQLLRVFLPFLVQSDGFFDHALSTSAGSLSPRTNWRDLAKYEFLLPPLDEQQRLADLLWAAERHLGSVRDKSISLDDARNAWLDSQLAELLDEDSAPFEALWSRSPESGWSAMPVDGLTGMHVLSLAALGPKGYRNGYLKNVEHSPQASGAVLRKGDLLVSRANTAELVGRVGIFSENREDVAFPDTMMRVSLDSGVRSQFAAAVLSSSHGRRHMRRNAAGSATSMVKINRTSLGNFPFPILSLAQQDELLDELQIIDQSIENTDTEESRLIAAKSHFLLVALGGVD